MNADLIKSVVEKQMNTKVKRIRAKRLIKIMREMGLNL